MNYTSTVLQAKNISVQFTTEKGCVQAVKDISIEVHKGKITALIGQSGSGKICNSNGYCRYFRQQRNHDKRTNIFAKSRHQQAKRKIFADI